MHFVVFSVEKKRAPWKNSKALLPMARMLKEKQVRVNRMGIAVRKNAKKRQNKKVLNKESF